MESGNVASAERKVEGGGICSCCGRPFTEVIRKRAMVHPSLFAEMGDFQIYSSCLSKQEKYSEEAIKEFSKKGENDGE